MAEIFNNSDSETEFEGFEVRDINAAEARYLQHIENMGNIDSDIEFYTDGKKKGEINFFHLFPE